MAATIDTYIELYWPGLTAALAALSADALTSLKAQATNQIGLYDTSLFSNDESYACQALMICIEAGGMAALDEWSEDRHYKQTVTKLNKGEHMDHWMGELERKLAAGRCRFSGEDGVISSRYAVKWRRPSVHAAPRLDQAPIPGIDTESSDARPDLFEDMDMVGP